MSQENVDMVRRAWEQFLTSGDIPRELIHEDAEIHWNSDIPGTSVYYGADGLAKALREWQENWEGTEYEFFEMTDAGDHVLVGFRETGHARGGLSVEHDWYQVYTFREGKLASLREFSGRSEALQAAEMSEAGAVSPDEGELNRQ